MLRPEIMGPPIRWLLSDEVRRVQRPAHHRGALGREPARREAAKKASRAIGWPELSSDAVWLTK